MNMEKLAQLATLVSVIGIGSFSFVGAGLSLALALGVMEIASGSRARD